MLLDVRLVQAKEMMCTEIALASIAKFNERRYEMAFSKAWNFTFHLDESSSNFGSMIQLNDLYSGYLLEKHHGVKIEENHFRNNKSLLKYIITELEHQNPVLTFIDVKYWRFAKEQDVLAGRIVPFLIVGYDFPNENLYCIDLHHVKRIETLSIENFLKGSNSKGVIYRILEREDDLKVDWRDVIMSSAEGAGDMFSHLNVFSESIADFLEKDKDISGKTIFEKTEFFNKMTDLLRSRYLFSLTLHYLGQLHGVQSLESLANEFVHVSSKWSIIRSLLLKTYYKGDFQVEKKHIAAKIKDLQSMEESLCSSLLNVSEYSRSSKKANQIQDNPVSHKTKTIINVDLQSYFNNKGIATEQSVSANFTGTGEYLVLENTPPNKVTVHEMEFLFPTIGNLDYDNISCSGDKIIVENNCYSTIMFLGCSEWGNYSDILQIEYSNGETDQLTLSFSDFSHYDYWEHEGQHVAIEFRCFEHMNDTPINKGLRYMYAKSYQLKGDKMLKSIKLPDCPNIHILAISLSSSNSAR